MLPGNMLTPSSFYFGAMRHPFFPHPGMFLPPGGALPNDHPEVLKSSSRHPVPSTSPNNGVGGSASGPITKPLDLSPGSRNGGRDSDTERSVESPPPTPTALHHPSMRVPVINGSAVNAAAQFYRQLAADARSRATIAESRSPSHSPRDTRSSSPPQHRDLKFGISAILSTPEKNEGDKNGEFFSTVYYFTLDLLNFF